MRFLIITLGLFGSLYAFADYTNKASAATLACKHPFSTQPVNLNKVKCVRVKVNLPNKTQALMRVRIWKRRASCTGNKGPRNGDVFQKNNKWVARVIFYCTKPANKLSN